MNEISKDTARGYMLSAIGDRKRRDEKISKASELNRKKFSSVRHKNIGKMMDKNQKRDAGISKAIDRLQKEEMTTTADAGIPHDTKNMGPRIKTTVMHDQRRRKDAMPVLLKRFRKYFEDKGI